VPRSKTDVLKELELTPPDPNRCQAEMPNGEGPFTLGGGHKMIRCTNEPTVIVTEKEEDEYGQAGAMSLCGSCLKVFNAQAGTPEAFVRRIES
jgi:hypothetical protein